MSLLRFWMFIQVLHIVTTLCWPHKLVTNVVWYRVVARERQFEVDLCDPTCTCIHVVQY